MPKKKDEVVTDEELKSRILKSIKEMHAFAEKYKEEPILDSLTASTIFEQIFEEPSEDNAQQFNRCLGALVKEGRVTEEMRSVFIYPLKGKAPKGLDTYGVSKIVYLIFAITVSVATFYQIISLREALIAIGSLLFFLALFVLIAIVLSALGVISKSRTDFIERLKDRWPGFLVALLIFGIGYISNYFLASLAVAAILVPLVPEWRGKHLRSKPNNEKS